MTEYIDFDGLMQKRRNSNILAMELRLFRHFIKPLPEPMLTYFLFYPREQTSVK